jgi:hypothetical protein
MSEKLFQAMREALDDWSKKEFEPHFVERSRMKRQLEAADRLAEMVKHHLTLLYDKDASPEDIQDAEVTLHCRLKTYRDARGEG